MTGLEDEGSYLPGFVTGERLVPVVRHLQSQLTARTRGGERQRQDLALQLEQEGYAPIYREAGLEVDQDEAPDTEA